MSNDTICAWCENLMAAMFVALVAANAAGLLGV